MLYQVSSELLYSSEPVTFIELVDLAAASLNVDNIRFYVEPFGDTVRLYAQTLTYDARLPFIDWKPSSRPHTQWSQVARVIYATLDQFERGYHMIHESPVPFPHARAVITLDEALAAARDAYEAFKVKPLVLDEPPAAQDERIKAYRDMLGALMVLHFAAMHEGIDTGDLNRALFGLLDADEANTQRTAAIDRATSQYLNAAFILFDELNEGA